MQNRFILTIGSLLCLSPKFQNREDLLTNNRKLPESLKQMRNSGQVSTIHWLGEKNLLSLTLEILLWYWKNLEQQSLSCPWIKNDNKPFSPNCKERGENPVAETRASWEPSAVGGGGAPFVLSHLLSSAFTEIRGGKDCEDRFCCLPLSSGFAAQRIQPWLGWRKAGGAWENQDSKVLPREGNC